MDVSLKGRSAIITGGSMGLGLATAQRFAASGADVAIVARGKEALDAAVTAIKASAQGKVMAVSADVSRAADIERAFGEAVAAFGKIDIVMNNAGAVRTAPIETLTDELLQADLDQKLFAALRLTRLAWPQMKERRWGRVINSLAISAKAPGGGSAPTSVTRAAGMALTKVLAGEGAPHNILVNALLVGSISSTQHVRGAERARLPVDQFLAQRGKGMPMGRVGRAEEFANLACFLASEQASYVTGTAINVDGGLSPVV